LPIASILDYCEFYILPSFVINTDKYCYFSHRAMFGTSQQQEHEQCFCLCDDTKDRFMTMRYFSLREVYLRSNE
jgi:hypothetical protein